MALLGGKLVDAPIAGGAPRLRFAVLSRHYSLAFILKRRERIRMLTLGRAMSLHWQSAMQDE